MAPKKEVFTMRMKPEKLQKPTKNGKVEKNKAKKNLDPNAITPSPKDVHGKENKQKKLQKPVIVSKTEKVKGPLVLAPAKEPKSDIPTKNKNKRKPKKNVLPTEAVTQDLVTKCVAALEKLAEHHKKGNRIFEDETAIFAEINCIKIQSSKGNIKFELPNSTIPSTGEVCLVTPDLKKGKKVDHEPTVDHWEELLRKSGVTNVKTVLPMRQLRVEYDQFELKRRLLTQHDFILVDTRVLNHVSHLLGKMFFKKHNMLIPVRINEKDLKKSIDAGLRTAMLRLNIGPTSTIQVGHTGMEQKLIRENVLSLLKQLKDKYPGGEANIRSLSLKLPLSLSVPLYLTLRPNDTVHAPKLVKEMPKNYKIVEDELSTMLHSRVAVAPDGTVILKKSVDEDDSDMEEDPEMEEEGAKEPAKEDGDDDQESD